jgi:hypothetical protein
MRVVPQFYRKTIDGGCCIFGLELSFCALPIFEAVASAFVANKRRE